MQARLTVLAAIAFVGIASTASPQYGHPLKGTWSGDWGPSQDKRQHVLLDLDWDGKAITGRINPGPDAVNLRTASLDPATWRVHLEADRTEPAVHYVIDGVLQNLGSPHRMLTGTWTEGGVKGAFKLIRN